MKTTFILCSIALPFAASGQKLEATSPAKTYRVEKQAPLYRTPADTAKKTGFFLSSGDDATVVGEFSPRWVIVRRTGALYLTPTNKLVNYNSAALAAERAADAAGIPVDPQTKLIAYQGVVEVPGVSKADLYTRAHAWVANTYRSANAVIQMNDKEAGQLVAKGLTRVTTKSLGIVVDAGVVRHTLTIYVKDGRYKYVLTNLAHEAGGAANILSAGPLEQEQGNLYALGTGKKLWNDIKQQANRDAYNLIAELQESMVLKGKKDPSDF